MGVDYSNRAGPFWSTVVNPLFWDNRNGLCVQWRSTRAGGAIPVDTFHVFDNGTQAIGPGVRKMRVQTNALNKEEIRIGNGEGDS